MKSLANATAKDVRALCKDLYVVFYQMIGSRCSGSYLVRAKDSREAVRIVKAIDGGYVPSGHVALYDEILTAIVAKDSWAEVKSVRETRETFEDELAHMLKSIGRKKYYQIECGT